MYYCGYLYYSDRRTQTPSILSAITGSGYFSCIDPTGSGYSGLEDIIELWESFGIGHDEVITVLDVSISWISRLNLQFIHMA